MARGAHSYGERWPLGLSRVEAAEFIGVGTTKFDELVRDHRMPGPKHIDGRVLWDRDAVALAFKVIDADDTDDTTKARRAWEDRLMD